MSFLRTFNLGGLIQCANQLKNRHPSHLGGQPILICIDYSVEEITLGIVCGCLTALPAFTRHISVVKNKIIKGNRGRSKSALRWWRPSTRNSIPESLNLPERSAVLSPSLRDASVYNSGKLRTPVTTGLEKGKNKRHDQWEELDELALVAGDDERYVKQEPSIVKPQRPLPILKQESLKDVRLDCLHL